MVPKGTQHAHIGGEHARAQSRIALLRRASWLAAHKADAATRLDLPAHVAVHRLLQARLAARRQAPGGAHEHVQDLHVAEVHVAAHLAAVPPVSAACCLMQARGTGTGRFDALCRDREQANGRDDADATAYVHGPCETAHAACGRRVTSPFLIFSGCAWGTNVDLPAGAALGGSTRSCARPRPCCQAPSPVDCVRQVTALMRTLLLLSKPVHTGLAGTAGLGGVARLWLIRLAGEEGVGGVDAGAGVGRLAVQASAQLPVRLLPALRGLHAHHRRGRLARRRLGGSREPLACGARTAWASSAQVLGQARSIAGETRMEHNMRERPCSSCGLLHAAGRPAQLLRRYAVEPKAQAPRQLHVHHDTASRAKAVHMWTCTASCAPASMLPASAPAMGL